MLQPIHFLQDLTIVMAVAAAVTFLFHKLRQPVVVGYLAAGIIVGPHTPPYALISNIASVETMASLGVIFLLFALGVEFNLGRLYKVGLRASAAAFIKTLPMILMGYWLGRYLGFGRMDCLLLGCVLSISSTAIVAKLVLDTRKGQGQWAELVTGILIAEDVIAICLIAFIASAASTGTLQVLPFLQTFLRFGFLITFLLVAGLLIVPKILDSIARLGVPEVRTIAVITMCFALALLTEKMGYSMALGAFVAGTLMAQSDELSRIRHLVDPFRDLFGAIFFVAVGMLIDPTWIVEHWRMVLLIALAVCLGRFVCNFAGILAAGQEPGHTLYASLALTPIGEFSFIIAQLGISLKVSEQPLYPISVVVCLFTTWVAHTLLPPTLRRADRVGRILPERLERLLSAYHLWLKKLSVPARAHQAWFLCRPSALQIGLNLAGISGLFLLANAIEGAYLLNQKLPGSMWVACTCISLPFLIAIWRKLQAVIFILVEAAFSSPGSPDDAPLVTYRFLVRFLMSAGTAIVAWWFFLLSVPLLPGWPYSLALVILIAVFAGLLWRSMLRFYANIQVALRQTLSRSPSGFDSPSSALSYIASAASPKDVEIREIRLALDSHSVGKSLRDLAISSRTGAAVLQVNRSKTVFHNPKPSLELHPKDTLLIIGEPKQIRKAKDYLMDGK